MTTTTQLRYEVKYAGGPGRNPGPPGWVVIGQVPATRGRNTGSVTDMTTDRDIIVFTNHGDFSTIQRSRHGTDYEIGRQRVVHPAGGMELLARLGPGESYERDMLSAKGRLYRARWTHQQK